MRILVAHSRYSSGNVSGENRVVDDEVKLLSDAGHDVVSWTPSTAGTARLRLAARSFWSLDAARRLARLARAHGADVVHLHNLFPMLSPAVIRTLSPHVPVVLTLHNYRLLCLPGTLFREGQVCETCVGRSVARGIVRGCYRHSRLASGALGGSLEVHKRLASFRGVSRFLAVSSFVREKHRAAGLEGDIRVKPNFAWPRPRRRGPGRYFLFAGRLTSEKGLDVLLSAWGAVDAPLVVAGDGPDAARLRQAAPANVSFVGARTPAEVDELLHDARALLAPSKWYEGAPRSILEAFASGVPVVAPPLGSLGELVEGGVSGVTVARHDAEGWQAAVDRLRDDAFVERLGEGAWAAWSRHYSPAASLAALEQTYREVAA